MLYDPKWEQKTDQTFEGVSLLGLIAWLECQPADKPYDYTEPTKCVLAQFLQATEGRSGVASIVNLPCEYSAGGGWLRKIAQGDASVEGQTFGAALERARAALR